VVNHSEQDIRVISGTLQGFRFGLLEVFFSKIRPYLHIISNDVSEPGLGQSIIGG